MITLTIAVAANQNDLIFNVAWNCRHGVPNLYVVRLSMSFSLMWFAYISLPV
jgi:hypothetical protein